MNNFPFLKRLRDVCIFSASVLGVTAVYRFLQKGPHVRVIVFHDVINREWFLQTISYIAQKYHVVSPQDFRAGRFDTTRINVLVTLDDGYASWVDTCLPILADKKIHALFFVNSGLLDCAENPEALAQYVTDRLLLTPRKTITWDGVRQLMSAGHMIGGHTTTHARLSELSHEAQQKEIFEDKQRIEFETGRQILDFAYPFGQSKDYTQDTSRIITEGGYTSAFTTNSGFVDTGREYTIPRLCIEETLSCSVLGHWIEGGYDVYIKMKKLCVR